MEVHLEGVKAVVSKRSQTRAHVSATAVLGRYTRVSSKGREATVAPNEDEGPKLSIRDSTKPAM